MNFNFSKLNIFTHLKDLAYNYTQSYVDKYQLMRLETQLMANSFIKVLLSLFLLTVFIAAFWLTLLGFIFFSMLAMHYTLLHSGLVLLFINLMMVLTVSIYLAKVSRFLSFSGIKSVLKGNS